MSIPSLKIRNFHAADFECLYRMDHICFAKGIAFSREELAFYLSHRRGIARIAEQSGVMVGFILAEIERRSIGHMITLDVAPEYRRRGIGETLMQSMHREFERRDIGVSILEVAVENKSAQALYKKLGYQQTETLFGYYRGKDDAYRMAAGMNKARE
jgi:[ribosomal protein S18]-alanine N-acetyltransferase